FPLVLELLNELNLKITFFLVGSDAARPANGPHLRALTDRGHEVGNHSYEHECWLHLYAPEALEEEIARAEEAILAATGQRPRGFRGPGFSWSPTLFEILERRGYRYDASTLPTFIGPLARRYFLTSSDLTAEERQRRSGLFGAFSDGFRPNRPYRWRLADGRGLLEIPVTTIPVVRVPFHLSYLLYLSRVSDRLMTAYLDSAIAACRVFGVEPSFLLHPLDLLGGEQVPELAFFPGMDLPGPRKVTIFLEVLERLGRHFELVPMGAHADVILARKELAWRRPVLAV
ncbi:MAG: polysaccharide deacetylase family protein, partial [Gemmatimonadales bacterium]